MRRYSASRRASSSAASSGSSSESSSSSSGKSPRAFSSSSAATKTRNSPQASRSSRPRSSSREQNDNTISTTSTSASSSSSRSTSVSSRSNGPSKASRSSSSSRTITAGKLAALPDATLGHCHRGPGRLDPAPPDVAGLRFAPDELPPDEEPGREDEEHDRDQRVDPQPEEVVRGIDPQELLEEPPEAVVGDVQREQRRRPDPEPPTDEDQQPRADRVVDELVEEGRVVGARALVLERNIAFVLNVDLQPPGQARRFAVELLIPVVAPPADPLREQEPRCDGVHEQEDAGAGAVDDPGTDHAAEEDPAPDAEAALPDRERAPPVVGHLVPARDVVVSAGPDDAGCDAPDRHPQHQVGVAAEPLPAHPRQPDAGDDREQQHQAVHVDRPAEDVEDAGVRRRDRGEQQGHRRDMLPVGPKACLQQDFDGHRNRAALPDQIGREMEIDIVPGRQPGRVANRIAGPLELLGAPLLDPVELGVQAELSFRRSHTYRFGGRRILVVTFPGGSNQTEVQLATLSRYRHVRRGTSVAPDRSDAAKRATRLWTTPA